MSLYFAYQLVNFSIWYKYLSIRFHVDRINQHQSYANMSTKSYHFMMPMSSLRSLDLLATLSFRGFTIFVCLS